MGEACLTQQMGIVWGRQEGGGPQGSSWAHGSISPGEQTGMLGLQDPNYRGRPRAPRRSSCLEVSPASWVCTGAVVAWCRANSQ